MMFTQPTHYFLCSGSSEGFSSLNAFDGALLKSHVGDTNLVRMSSILPPYCKRVEPFRLPYGALVPVAYADMVCSEEGIWIAAAVAIGIPHDPSLPGLIMEHHGEGRLEDIESKVREMSVQGMAMRNREIKEIVSIGVEHQVEQHGGCFAGVVLWNSATSENTKRV